MIASLRSYAVVTGAVLFIVNLTIIEPAINLPASEFGIIACIFLSFYKCKKIHYSGLAFSAVIVLGLMVCWTFFAELYHSHNFGDALRALLRPFVYYVIILGYLLLPDKRLVFRFSVGLMIGHIVFFLAIVLMYGLTDPNTLRQYKFFVPPPLLFFLVLFIYRQYFSRTICYLKIISFSVYLVTIPLISGRGALLSLLVAALFYALGYIKTALAPMISIFITCLPFLFIAPALYFYASYDIWGFYRFLEDINYVTISNVERLFILFKTIQTLLEEPLIGIGRYGLPEIVQPYITEVIPFRQSSAASPHNYYLEIAVPYGIPPMLMAMFMLWVTYASMLKTARKNGRRDGIAFAIAATISWAMLVNTGAGISRFITFYLVIFGLYEMNSGVQEKERNASTEAEETI